MDSLKDLMLPTMIQHEMLPWACPAVVQKPSVRGATWATRTQHSPSCKYTCIYIYMYICIICIICICTCTYIHIYIHTQYTCMMFLQQYTHHQLFHWGSVYGYPGYMFNCKPCFDVRLCLAAEAHSSKNIRNDSTWNAILAASSVCRGRSKGTSVWFWHVSLPVSGRFGVCCWFFQISAWRSCSWGFFGIQLIWWEYYFTFQNQDLFVSTLWSVISVGHQVSNEKKPGCLGYIGNYTAQLYGD